METLLDRLQQRVASQPDHPLLVSPSRELTYAEFWKQSVALSETIAKRGLLPGDRVAIYSEDFFEVFTALFALWLRGMIAVPLNPTLPLETNQAIIERVRPSLFLVSINRTSISASAKSLSFEKTPQSSTLSSRAFPPRPHSVAMIQFTSGTTGIPKGVLLTLEALSLNAALTSKALGLQPIDKLFINTPPYFTSAQAHLLSMIQVGGTLVVQPGFLFGSTLALQLDQLQCTGFGGAPAHLARWIETVSADQYPKSLRFWLTSGDFLNETLTLKALESFPSLQIYAMYGLTEVSGRLCVLPPSALPKKAGSAGRPLPEMTLTICDEQRTPVPCQKVGQIYVQGSTLMQGYDGESPLSANDEFPTGDYGYFDPDGYLWLVGRQDDIFKSGAEKVSTVAIEKAILSSQLCSEAAVLPIENDLLGKVPCAFVVPVAKESFQRKNLLHYLRDHLPPSHIPKRVVVLDELPRTAVGKLARKELSELVFEPTRRTEQL